MLEGWTYPVLSEVADFVSGGTPNKANPEFWGGNVPWVTVSDMKSLKLVEAQYNLTKAGATQVRNVNAGTVLVLVRGMGLFKDLPILLCEDTLTFNQDIKGLVPHEGVESEFLAYALIARKSEILRHVDTAGHGTGRLDTDLLKSTPIPLPPLPEQRRIAEILRTWDEAIEKLKALRSAKIQRFNGISASLIHDPQTQQLHLRDILTEVSKRNKGSLVKRVLSVTNSMGFVLASDQFAHRVASTDISNYKVVRRGQYAYNPSRINVGSIARLNDWDEGALSPMYIVFQTRPEIDSDYFGHWLGTGEARQRIALSAQGSVRETVGFSDLGSVPIPAPSLEKQTAISAALDAGTEELTHISTQIDALQRQKRGLMQKLLTGEWRVNAGEDNNEISEKEIAHG